MQSNRLRHKLFHLGFEIEDTYFECHAEFCFLSFNINSLTEAERVRFRHNSFYLHSMNLGDTLHLVLTSTNKNQVKQLDFWSKLVSFNPEFTYPIIFTIIGSFWTIITSINNRKNRKLKERLDKIEMIRKLNTELKMWADEVMDVLSNVGHLCELDPQRTQNFFLLRHNLLVQLSALIDKGRFYLPNIDANNYGQHKSSAFQGITREPLTQMKICYQILDKKLSYSDQRVNSPLKQDFMKAKRAFCSSIQNELNPQKYFIDLRSETEHEI